MAYETGTALSPPDLLDKIRNFCANNGWTVNSFANDGTGKRLHIQRATAAAGTVYFNFRSYVAESSKNSIQMNGSTGYNGASAWNLQPGVPTPPTGTDRGESGIGLTGAINSYHFFAHNGGDQIYCFVEQPLGVFQFMLFGAIEKLGTWTGGQFYTAPQPFSGRDARSSQFAARSLFKTNEGFGASSAYNNGGGYLYVSAVDGYTGWLAPYNTSTRSALQMSVGDRAITDAFASLWGNSPNSFNQRAILKPLPVMISRNGNSTATSDPASVVGMMPNLFYLNIANLIVGSQLVIGADAYRILPLFSKGPGGFTGAFGTGATSHSGDIGLAVHE